MKNVDNSKKIIKKLLSSLDDKRTCGCGDALKYAIITDRKMISSKVKKNLKLIVGKYVR